MIQEGVKMQGKFEVLKYAANGKLVDQRMVYNVITTVGKAKMAGLILSDCTATSTSFDYIAIGTSTNVATNTQTALVGEYNRTAGAGTLTTSGTPDDTAQLVAATMSFTGSASIGEAGVFSSSNSGAGVMLARQVFAMLNVTSGDSIVVTYKITMV